jgi:hypothetical protein
VYSIREILKEETGKARVPHGQLVEVAAKVLDCSPDEIEEIVKRGYRFFEFKIRGGTSHDLARTTHRSSPR